MPLKRCWNCSQRIDAYPCQYCKYDPLAKDAPPMVPSKDVPKKEKEFPWIFVGAGVILLASTGVFGSFRKEATPTPSNPVVDTRPVNPDDLEGVDVAEVELRVDVEEMWTDYAVNPTLADEKYKGNNVAILGRVITVAPETGRMRISSQEDTSHQIVVTIRGVDHVRLVGVEVDDLVILVCRPLGLLQGVIVIENCAFVR